MPIPNSKIRKQFTIVEATPDRAYIITHGTVHTTRNHQQARWFANDIREMS